MPSHVDSVRRFNRFYTKQIGVLRKGYLDSAFSLGEGRVLYEIAQRDRPIAAEISKDLDLDPGYLSRLLAKFEKQGLIRRKASGDDARQSHLSLTAHGRAVFAPLDRKSQKLSSDMLRKLSSTDQQRLVDAMRTIESLLGTAPETAPQYTLRAPRAGDMGWVVHLHGKFYWETFAWDESFEALTAEIVAKFVKDFDPQRERCWIAERDGVNLGCVFLVKKTDRVAKLRLLIVDPAAHGLGIGKRLVDECIRFARQAGYRKMTLWTQSNLLAARGIYKNAGFQLVKQWPVTQFGHRMTSETWDLEL
ncbi:MAG TPA: helix-turn-helix domain-containing GNAT family N-acetyltransferase [Bryobacteraceae bacterium]|nr:helix-turn-helix domain-containing GNAT family N-acetyltransferase [Bryobacteraceae bacterium]